MTKEPAPEVEAGEVKSSKKKLVVVAVVVLAAASWKLGFLPVGQAKPAAAEGPQAEKAVEQGAVLPMDELTLNLSDGRFLRLGVALILEQGQSTEEMKEQLPIAGDVVVTTLSSRTYPELLKPEAKDAVKLELTDKVRAAYEAAFGEPKVARVIFTSFVMQ